MVVALLALVPWNGLRPAWAGTPAGELAWRWNAPVRFHAEALVGTPQGVDFLGASNVNARARKTAITLDLTCAGQPDGKNWSVECTIDEAAMHGTAYAKKEQDKLDRIFHDYAGYLSGAKVQVDMLADGRLRDVDLEGVPKSDERMSRIHESLRELIRRGLAPLDLELPRHGEALDKPWRQKGAPLAFEMLTSHGTVGGATFKHELKGKVGVTQVIVSSGYGNVGTGETIEAGTPIMVEMEVKGAARFDLVRGQMAYSQLMVTGELTADASGAGPADYYSCAAWVGRIDPNGKVEGPNGPEDWPPKDKRGAASDQAPAKSSAQAPPG